jgi:hypothetical protein
MLAGVFGGFVRSDKDCDVRRWRMTYVQTES